MTTKKVEIRRIVVDSISEVTAIPPTFTIDEKTDPIRHLGLDSFDGVACACCLSNKLNFRIPENFNPFVDDKRRRSRCISEIVDVLIQIMEQKEERCNE